MKAVTNAVKRDQSRDSFWTKIDFFTENNKKTSFLLCASYEYLTENLDSDEVSDELLNNWVQNEVKDIEIQGEVIFNKPQHITVRAVTEDGYQNGVSFLAGMTV